MSIRPLARMALLLALTLTLAACAPRTSQTQQDTATSTANGALSADEAKIDDFSGKLMNTPAADFTLKDLDGKSWKLSELQGKVVLLNFWATWCPPCQAEMPDFQRLQGLGRDDVVVLAVASASTEGQDAKTSLDAVTQFVRGQKYTFPVLFDADGSVWAAYQQQGIPANYILDTQGKVRLLQVGAWAHDDDLLAALEAVRRLDGK